MKLSLSVRIVESPCKTKLALPIEQLARLAKDLGYEAVCMRASAAGIQTAPRERQRIAHMLASIGLTVSMITPDFDIPLNNDNGPNCLRHIGPSLDVAEDFHCNLVRVCLKSKSDIPFAAKAADEAAKRGIRLAHQCHTTSIFETVDGIVEVLKAIDRPNFGLIYEPANLMLCDQPYGPSTLARFRSHLMNVYVQNHQLEPNGPVVLPTFCRGDVRFHHLNLWDIGGVDFTAVFNGLRQIAYDGYFTIHQAQGIEDLAAAEKFAGECSNWWNRQVRG